MEKLPGVSIIKPLTGCDDNLFDNLETFFNIDYPMVSCFRGFWNAFLPWSFVIFLSRLKFELLFCIQDNTDPSIGVVKRLMDKYPHIDAKLFTGSCLFSFSVALLALTFYYMAICRWQACRLEPKNQQHDPRLRCRKVRIISDIWRRTQK